MTRTEALSVLGLSVEAGDVQVRTAYRDLVKVWHPDRFASEPRVQQRAMATLQQINEAYACLKRQARAHQPWPAPAPDPAPYVPRRGREPRATRGGRTHTRRRSSAARGGSGRARIKATRRRVPAWVYLIAMAWVAILFFWG